MLQKVNSVMTTGRGKIISIDDRNVNYANVSSRIFFSTELRASCIVMCASGFFVFLNYFFLFFQSLFSSCLFIVKSGIQFNLLLGLVLNKFIIFFALSL